MFQFPLPYNGRKIKPADAMIHSLKLLQEKGENLLLQLSGTIVIIWSLRLKKMV